MPERLYVEARKQTDAGEAAKFIHEMLKRIREGVEGTDRNVDELKSKMQAFCGHMISLTQDMHNIYAILSRHDVRLDRLERRLEIAEPAQL